MEIMDIIAILLAIVGFICVALAASFVLFLSFEDFFRKVFKMKKKDSSNSVRGNKGKKSETA